MTTSKISTNQPQIDPNNPDLSQFTTTSSKIRYLTSLGWKRGQIALHLKIRYQHVRNVQLQPLKKVQ